MTRKLQYFLIISFIASLLLTPFFIRVNIECRSQFGECPQELEDGIGKLEGGSLYQTRRKIASYLKNNFSKNPANLKRGDFSVLATQKISVFLISKLNI